MRSREENKKGFRWEVGKKIRKITEGRRKENKKYYRWEEGKKIRNVIDGKKGRKSEIL